MRSWTLKRPFIFYLTAMWAVLTACQNEPPTLPAFAPETATLDRQWSARGERVELASNLVLLGSGKIEVLIGGEPADGVKVTATGIEFGVPSAAAAGSQPVLIYVDGALALETEVTVLGDDVVAGEFTLVAERGTTVNDLERMLDQLTISVIDGPHSLGAATGICSGELVTIRVYGSDTGSALHRLREATVVEGGIWHSDPKSGYDSGATSNVRAAQAVGAGNAHERGFTGAGTTIAVVDTGVSPHRELDDRLLMHLGYDFVDEGTRPLDAYIGGGHGTPIAVLAAGAKLGVAPGASVLPVRVCDENGVCHTNNIVRGLCHALNASESSGVGKLVLNLSMGGETPNDTIEAILRHGLDQGALIAMSGGNKGEQGSPAHYPAAYQLHGALAVAALESPRGSDDWRPASFSNRGDHLDIAAPGVNLRSGSNEGQYSNSNSGTSFATAVAAGALALWREAYPDASSLQIASELKRAARPLEFGVREVGAGMLDLSEAPAPTSR